MMGEVLASIQGIVFVLFLLHRDSIWSDGVGAMTRRFVQGYLSH
jgi:hypothetical protein